MAGSPSFPRKVALSAEKRCAGTNTRSQPKSWVHASINKYWDISNRWTTKDAKSGDIWKQRCIMRQLHDGHISRAAALLSSPGLAPTCPATANFGSRLKWDATGDGLSLVGETNLAQKFIALLGNQRYALAQLKAEQWRISWLFIPSYQHLRFSSCQLCNLSQLRCLLLLKYPEELQRMKRVQRSFNLHAI